jgi:glycosyltransferase involved in cell wall biosynthesis
MGGAEVFTREVASRLVKLGHRVTLFTAEFENCRHEEVSDGVRIVRAGGKYSVYWQAKAYYKKRFSKEKYDLVVDEINTRPFFAPKFVNNGEKVVALIHQLAREYWFYETRFPVNYLGYYFLENRWLKNYVRVPTVTVSDSTRKDLLALGFRSVWTVSEGLNFDPFDKLPEKSESPLIIYSGRLTKAKRPDHAIRAFVKVKERFPNAELWMIGKGPFEDHLKSISPESVKFQSDLTNVERRELVGRAWVLVNPSVREGFGLNVIEANAVGTPCVGYDVPGLRDSIENQHTGLLSRAGDIDDLTDKIVRVLEDETLRRHLCDNALEYSRQFTWDKSAQEFLTAISASD